MQLGIEASEQLAALILIFKNDAAFDRSLSSVL